MTKEEPGARQMTHLVLNLFPRDGAGKRFTARMQKASCLVFHAENQIRDTICPVRQCLPACLTTSSPTGNPRDYRWYPHVLYGTIKPDVLGVYEGSRIWQRCSAISRTGMRCSTRFSTGGRLYQFELRSPAPRRRDLQQGKGDEESGGDRALLSR